MLKDRLKDIIFTKPNKRKIMCNNSLIIFSVEDKFCIALQNSFKNAPIKFQCDNNNHDNDQVTRSSPGEAPPEV